MNNNNIINFCIINNNIIYNVKDNYLLHLQTERQSSTTTYKSLKIQHLGFTRELRLSQFDYI